MTMNALIQQVIGEASFDRQAGIIGFTPRRTPMPSQSADELVQQHLDTQGAGVPPAGRQYPSAPSEPAAPPVAKICPHCGQNMPEV
jgi:hypothetical protein